MKPEFDIDLGSDHYLQFARFAPDRALNPQYADLPDEDSVGAIIYHKKPDGSDCAGSVNFDGPVTQRVFPKQPRWTVEKREPLTLSPSIACSCGDHGYIREGRWVKA